MRSIVGVAFALVGALAACDVPRAPRPKVWTLFDVQALYADGKSGSAAIALDAGLPGGVKLEKLLSPVDPTTLFARPTITEGYNGSYLTTEVWSHFDEVWLQPMYIPVVAWDNGMPTPLTTNGSEWVFGVGPRSGFYSPFWQMVYFDVDKYTPLGSITSARQVLDGGYPLHFGPGRTVSLVPPDVVAPTDGAPPVSLVQGTAWLDGQPVSFIDFGKATFTWNDDAVIDELPLYVFLMRASDGSLVAPDIQTVAGTGPPGSGGPPAPILAGQPRYVAYWRLYTVTLPATARVFAPTPELQTKLTMEPPIPVVTTYNADDQLYLPQTGWVALKSTCFGSAARLDPDPSNPNTDHCIWLNSQAAIEANLDPTAIQRTDVTVTCPFVTFNGATVSPIK